MQYFNMLRNNLLKIQSYVKLQMADVLTDEFLNILLLRNYTNNFFMLTKQQLNVLFFTVDKKIIHSKNLEIKTNI